MLIGDLLEICFLGEIPANQPHAVLHAPLLPALVWLAKIGLRLEGRIDSLVGAIFCPIVIGEGVAAILGFLCQCADDEIGHQACGFPGEALQLQQAARALVQHAQRRGAPGRDGGIAFPVADLVAKCHA